MNSERIYECLKPMSTNQAGELIAWNPPNEKQVRGLPEYLLQSGLWSLIVDLAGVSSNLKFSRHDVEQAVMRKLPHASPITVCMEAKKIMVLLNGWRRVERHGYAVPETLRSLMRSPPRTCNAREPCKRKHLIKNFMSFNDSDVDSLESCSSNDFSAAHEQTGTGEEQEAEKEQLEQGGDEDDEIRKAHEPDFILVKGWAVRTHDKEKAHNAEKAKKKGTLFTWSDGDRWVCADLAFDAAKSQSKAKETTASSSQQSTEKTHNMEQIWKARKACCASGAWRVGVNPRPKYRNGGWEVSIKRNGSQTWSKGSNAQVKIGDGALASTIAFANDHMKTLMQECTDDN